MIGGEGRRDVNPCRGDTNTRTSKCIDSPRNANLAAPGAEVCPIEHLSAKVASGGTRLRQRCNLSRQCLGGSLGTC